MDREAIRGAYSVMEGLLDGKMHEGDVMVTVSAECASAVVVLARCAEQMHAQDAGVLFSPEIADLVRKTHERSQVCCGAFC